MKRRIEPKQLEELTFQQKVKLKEWWKPQPGDYFASIYEVQHGMWSVVGACAGYNQCECVIDDEEDPSEQPKGDCLPLLDIGQMIELLRETNFDKLVYLDHTGTLQDHNLCDALWQAVKQVLGV